MIEKIVDLWGLRVYNDSSTGTANINCTLLWRRAIKHLEYRPVACIYIYIYIYIYTYIYTILHNTITHYLGVTLLERLCVLHKYID